MSEEKRQTNSADRLYNILINALNQPESDTLKKVWATVLHADVNDELDVINKVITLNNLAKEVENTLSDDESINNNIYLYEFGKIYQAISPGNLNEQWANKKVLLNEGLITTLKFCVHNYPSKFKENVVGQDVIDGLLKQVRKLIDLFTTSNLEEEVKSRMVAILYKIEEAISMYNISGTEGVNDVFERFVGSLSLAHQSLGKEFKKNNILMKETKEFLVNVADILKSSEAIIAISCQLVTGLLS